MTSPHPHMHIARARIDGLRRASRPGTHEAKPPTARGGDVMLRVASAADETLLAKPAALDSSRTPAEPVLLTLLDGEPVAALSLIDSTHLSDPFRPTIDLIDPLRARTRKLQGGRRNFRSRGTLRSATTRISTANPGGPA